MGFLGLEIGLAVFDRLYPAQWARSNPIANFSLTGRSFATEKGHLRGVRAGL
jgi:hypothetical protein